MRPFAPFSWALCLLAVSGCASNSRATGEASLAGSVADAKFTPIRVAHEDGQPWVVGGSLGGERHGVWKVFGAGGDLELSGGYERGREEGKWTWYHPGGGVYVQGQYSDGQRTGPWEARQPDGSPRWRGAFATDRKQGEWELWESGALRERSHFEQGVPHGGWALFHPNGRPQIEGEFTRGVRSGVWRELDDRGRLLHSKNMGTPSGSESTGPGAAETDPLRLLRRRVLRRVGPTFQLSESGPFVVASEVSRVETDRFATYLIEWFHGQMLRDFCRRAPPPASRTIYLFRTAKTYREAAEAWYGRAPDAAVGFANEEAILVDLATGSGTLVHELTHAYLMEDFPTIPVWLNEGIASLFEQSAEVEGKITGLHNGRLSRIQEAIADGTLVDLQTLLRMNDRQFRASDVELNYAQARYFCFYLQNLGALRTFYGIFRDNYRFDPSSIQTLLSVLGKTSPQEIQLDWITFLTHEISKQ